MHPIQISHRLLGLSLCGLFTIACVSTQPGQSEEDLELAQLDDSITVRPMSPKLTAEGVFFVASEDPKRPLARYLDGQLALSNTCGIKVENKLNRRIPPIYVNGQPIGFC